MSWPGDIRPARVELDIGALELTGFPATQRFAIARSVEQSLAELVAARGWPAGEAARHAEAGAAITLDSQAHHGVVGRAIAEAIFDAASSAATPRRSP
ncbi:hypothetical protein ACNOYE_00110 [Nannocystaceae bacterium ST9]